MARLAFSSERAAMYTFAFLEYRICASSLPTPVLEPVTMYTFFAYFN